MGAMCWVIVSRWRCGERVPGRPRDQGAQGRGSARVLRVDLPPQIVERRLRLSTAGR